jgi:hypothetical protein
MLRREEVERGAEEEKRGGGGFILAPNSNGWVGLAPAMGIQVVRQQERDAPPHEGLDQTRPASPTSVFSELAVTIHRASSRCPLTD